MLFYTCFTHTKVYAICRKKKAMCIAFFLLRILTFKKKESICTLQWQGLHSHSASPQDGTSYVAISLVPKTASIR